MSQSKSPRILITRLSHIGDCILTLPMLCALRRKLPDAYIAWAVEAPTQQLLKLHPDIDELIIVPKQWAKKPKCWNELFGKLRTPKFDYTIDPQGITKSAALARISRAKTRIGIRGRWGRELSPYLNNCLINTEAPHIVDRSLELLQPFGVSTTSKRPLVEFRLPVCSKAQQTTVQFLKQHFSSKTNSSGSPEKFAVINPGASWKSKRWETDRYATVASHLLKRHRIRSVVTWAGDEEKAMAERICSLNPEAAIMADKTSLAELAAICKEAHFFIGCDTGPLHIAAAMGTACVGLYGTTLPEDSGAYNQPHIGQQHIAVQKWHQSGSCRKRRRASNDAMRDIMAKDVRASCDQMLAQLDAKQRMAG